MKIKSPTNKEKIEVYEEVFRALHFHTHITNNQQAINGILQSIWELCDSKIKEHVDEAFWNLSSKSKELM